MKQTATKNSTDEDEVSLQKEDVLQRLNFLNSSVITGVKKNIREVVNKVGDKMKVSSNK